MHWVSQFTRSFSSFYAHAESHYKTACTLIKKALWKFLKRVQFCSKSIQNSCKISTKEFVLRGSCKFTENVTLPLQVFYKVVY